MYPYRAAGRVQPWLSRNVFIYGFCREIISVIGKGTIEPCQGRIEIKLLIVFGKGVNKYL